MTKWLDRNLVVSPIYFRLCKSEKEFNKELRRLKVPKNQRGSWINPGADATTHFLESAKGSNCAIVCIKSDKNRDPIEIAGLLVHEAVHIWQSVKRIIGEPNPSSEFEAYSIQNIAQQLMAGFQK